MELLRLYRMPGLETGACQRITGLVNTEAGLDLGEIATEYCYYAETQGKIPPEKLAVLRRCLAETFHPEGISDSSFLESPTIIEIGPRLNFETPLSSTAVSIFRDCGLDMITRLERSVRLGISRPLTSKERQAAIAPLFDRLVFDKMTQMEYPEPLTTFQTGIVPEPVRVIPVLEDGIEALKRFNDEMGLAFDEQDLAFLYNLYVNVLGRNPNSVELFTTLGQELSEHCDHGYWKGQRIIDGVEAPMSLMERARESWRANPHNTLIAFDDEASVMEAPRSVTAFVPSNPGRPSSFVAEKRLLHPDITGETHCHPTKVSPYPGAATGKARIRDNMSVGRGGVPLTAANGLIVGNLHLPGYKMPWEQNDDWRPIGAVSPLEIALQARDGAFDFGNADGEPEIGGFFYSIGVPHNQEFRSYFKPIFFTVGYGMIDDRHLREFEAEPGMVLVQIGGPAYPIGVGGGSRSSTTATTADDLAAAAEWDFDSVQRGGPFMQKLCVDVIRDCVECGDRNRIRRTKDLGAGGHCTADVEITGAVGLWVNLRDIPSGDPTMSTRIYFGNEAQERTIVVLYEKDLPWFADICARQSCPMAVIGRFTEGNLFVLYDSRDNSKPVELPLDQIFAKRPRKTFHIESVTPSLRPLELNGISFDEALNRVLRLPGVACKGWLTARVDRSVTGLVAQQQCVGPTQLPAADYSVTALSFLDTLGKANSIGVRPLIGLVSPEAMGRMVASEAILSLSGAVITRLSDIGYLANWMSDVKSPGEGVIVEKAARSLSEAMIKLGPAQVGGKDSSSLANLAVNSVGERARIKAPVTLVVSTEAIMPDIRRKVTPFVEPGMSLLFVDLSPWRKRLGTSALAQVLDQAGNDCPDANIPKIKRYFETVQRLVHSGKITAVHDISDGGLITTLLEMAFVSGCGLHIQSQNSRFGALRYYFAEEPGVVIACLPEDEHKIERQFAKAGICVCNLGHTIGDNTITISHNHQLVLQAKMTELRDVWMETSFRLDMQEANPDCITQERDLYLHSMRACPEFQLSFKPKQTPQVRMCAKNKPKAVVLKAPGTNGERELAGILYQAGFDPWIVTLRDLIDSEITLDMFKMMGDAGGFSYQDTLGAGRGAAAVIEENPQVWEQFYRFFVERNDTLSYHVCNGKQVITALGLVPFPGLAREKRPRMLANTSGKFESRIVPVRIEKSPAVMFQGIEGSILPIWVAHGEGRFFSRDDEILKQILQEQLVSLRYVGLDGEPTEDYPLNPNGSPGGIAGLCTPDGRHLAMMPHIERLFQLWQWPYLPPEWQELKASPWLKPFQNARAWCEENK